jgi:hypothetical protein
MTKKISFFVVTVAAVTLVLSGCGKGPGMDDMEMMDGEDMAPAYVGEWHIQKPADDSPATTVTLEAAAFTVTAGDKSGPIGTESPYNSIIMITVKGTLELMGTGLAFTVASVEPMFAPVVSQELQAGLKAGILATLMVADDEPVTVDIAEDGNSMTIAGKFIESVLKLPEGTKLMACKGEPCPADGGMTQ